MVDQWRRPHESDAEWRLRKEFLTAHYGHFPDNRLKCLSSCFVNVECFGCRYSEPVMKLLSELSVGLQEAARLRSKLRTPFTRKLMRFVPASSDDGDLKGDRDVKELLKAETSSADRTDPTSCIASSSMSPACPLSSAGVEEESSELEVTSKVTNRAGGSSEACRDGNLDGVFIQLRNVVRELVEKISTQKSSTEILQMSLDKCKLNAETKFTTSSLANAMTYTCTLVVNNVYVATGDATNKKASKHSAYSNAVEILQRPYLQVKFVDDKMRLVGLVERLRTDSLRFLACQNVVQNKPNLGKVEFRPSSENTMRPLARQQFSSASRPGQGMATASLQRPPLKQRVGSLSDFVILKSAASSNINETAGYLSVLQQSACFNKAEMKYNYSSVGDQFQCCVTLDGQQIGNAAGDCKSSAQVAAARQALCMLGRTCCTVTIKRPQDIEMDDSIKRTEVMDGKSDATKIPESNVGNMLLKKMGWTGGGIGKGGSEGIEEPVSLTAVINRAGLGSGVHGELAKSINRIVVDYLRSDREDDLVFSPEFSNEERAVIHTEARKHGQQLRTRSYGSKESRYLVLSRRRAPVELVRHIRNNGGETLKYILQEPTC